MKRIERCDKGGRGQPVCDVGHEILELPVRALVVSDVIELVAFFVCAALICEALVRRLGQGQWALPLLLRKVSVGIVLKHIAEAVFLAMFETKVCGWINTEFGANPFVRGFVVFVVCLGKVWVVG